MLNPPHPWRPRPVVGLLFLGLLATVPAGAQDRSPFRDVRGNALEGVRRDDQQREFEERLLGTAAEAGAPVVDEMGRTRGSMVVGFERELYVQNDLMLQGITAFETVVFTRPKAWTLSQDPVATIYFEHSASLSPNRSTLTVQVNGQGVASTRLDASNIAQGILQARIPRSILKDYNNLTLAVVQHIDDECEDPFDPALWTRVSNESTIAFDYWEAPVRGELSEFPFPIFDPLGYGPLEIAVAGPARVSPSQLDAIGRISFALGRHAAYRKVDFQDPVQDPATADSHVLVVGTPQDNPLVSRLVPQVPRAGEGLVAVVPQPGDPTRAALVVTGGDAAGLAKAVEAVTGADRSEILAGNMSLVESVEAANPPPTRQVPLPVPVESEFTLADMGMTDLTVRGYYAPPVTIPLRLEGDAHVQIEGARVGVDYAYSAYLDTRLSTMEVRLNGVTLRSIGLDEAEGAEKERLWVDLPFELLEPDSELEVIFHLFPIDFGPCVYITDKHIWGTVFASTELEINRDHYAMLPDLTLLRYDLWPYNEALRDNGVLIVSSNDPGLQDASAAGQFTAELGRRSVAERPDFQVVPASGGLADREPTAELVLLVGNSAHAVYEDLARAKKVSLPGDLERELRGEGGSDLMSATVTTSYGTIEQSVFPTNGRTALTLRAPSDAALPELIQLLQDEGDLRSLEGNVAVVADQQAPQPVVRTLSVVEPVQVGVIPLTSQVKSYLRGAWLFLGIAVLFGAFLLTLLARAWAARRGGQA